MICVKSSGMAAQKVVSAPPTYIGSGLGLGLGSGLERGLGSGLGLGLGFGMGLGLWLWLGSGSGREGAPPTTENPTPCNAPWVFS